MNQKTMRYLRVEFDIGKSISGAEDLTSDFEAMTKDWRGNNAPRQSNAQMGNNAQSNAEVV